MKLKFEVEIEVTEEFKKQFLFMMEDMIGAMSPLVSKNEFRKIKISLKRKEMKKIIHSVSTYGGTGEGNGLGLCCA